MFSKIFLFIIFFNIITQKTTKRRQKTCRTKHIQSLNIRPNNEVEEQDDKPFEVHQVKGRHYRRVV